MFCVEICCDRNDAIWVVVMVLLLKFYYISWLQSFYLDNSSFGTYIEQAFVRNFKIVSLSVSLYIWTLIERVEPNRLLSIFCPLALIPLPFCTFTPFTPKPSYTTTSLRLYTLQPTLLYRFILQTPFNNPFTL